MAILGDGTPVLFSTQQQVATVASTGTIVAKITSAQFNGVTPSGALNYHVTWVPGAQTTATWLLMQTTGSTTLLDPANAACRNFMYAQTLAGQHWNYDFYCRIEAGDALTVHMPNSSGATGVFVKLFAEPLL